MEWDNADEKHFEIHAAASKGVEEEVIKAKTHLNALNTSFDDKQIYHLREYAECFYRMGYVNALAWSADTLMKESSEVKLRDIQDEGWLGP